MAKPTLVVGAIWLGMLVAALGYVHTYGASCPFWDEWDMLPALTGREPLPTWLWEQHNEHRLPLPKLFWWSVCKLSSLDFKVAGYLNVLGQGGIALALMAGARRLRGRTEYADAFFPLLLLNWGHFENYTLGYQLTFVCTAAVVAGLLLAVLSRRPNAGLAGACVLLLPLCGAHGLAFVPGGVLWIAYLAWQSWCIGKRWPSIALVGCAAGAVLLTVVYFHNYHRPAGHATPGSLFDTARVALQVLALQFGWAANRTWPLSGVAALFVLAVGGVVLARTLWTNAAERPRVFGMATVVAGVVVIALGIGWGRSGFGDGTGFAPRYALLAAPILATAYFAALLYLPTNVGGRVTAGLCILLLLTVPHTTRIGRMAGQMRRAKTDAFAADVAAGISIDQLARKNAGAVYPDREVLAARLTLLHDAGIAPYCHLPLHLKAVCPQSPAKPTTSETP